MKTITIAAAAIGVAVAFAAAATVALVMQPPAKVYPSTVPAAPKPQNYKDVYRVEVLAPNRRAA